MAEDWQRGDGLRQAFPYETSIMDTWAEHESRLLNKSCGLAFAGEYCRWRLDKHTGGWHAHVFNRGREVSVAAAGGVCQTPAIGKHFAYRPRPHTLMDEFGHCFRAQSLETQSLQIISLYEGYDMLASLRVIESELQWWQLMKYLQRLSPARKELSKIIGDCWHDLRVAWRRKQQAYRSVQRIA